MFGSFVKWGSLVVVGIIIADIIANPQGTAAAAGGVRGLETPAFNALLGKTTQ